MIKLLKTAQGREIARVEVARTTAERMRGLLGRNGLPPGQGMLIERCSSIHTLFMKFSLDVIFLDRDGTVRKVVRRLAPWRLAQAFGAADVVELAAGALDDLPVQAGDVLKIEDAT